MANENICYYGTWIFIVGVSRLLKVWPYKALLPDLLFYCLTKCRFQDGQFKVDWASQAYCNFTIFVAVVMFVISLVQFWRFVKFFRRGRDSRS